MPKDRAVAACDIFINWPHAVDQFIERGGFPQNFDREAREAAKAVLRDLVVEAFNNGQERLTNVRNLDKQDGKDKFIFRIQVPHRQVVFPVIEIGKAGGRYAYMIHTVLDQQMYQSWSREQKLGTLADKLPELQGLKEQVRQQEVQRKMAEKQEEEEKRRGGAYLLEWLDVNQVRQRKYLWEDELGPWVMALLTEGISLNTIEAYQRVPLKLSMIDISIGDEK